MSTAPDSPKASKLGSLGTNFWLILLALSVIVFGANTGCRDLTRAAACPAPPTGAADLQVLSQQLANQGREAVGGNAEAFKAFKATKAQIESHHRHHHAAVTAPRATVSGPLNKLVATWTPLGKSADQLVSSEPAVLALAGNADRFSNQVPQLQAQLNEVVRAMSASGAPSSQIYNALQQVVVAGTMARRVTEMRAGGSGAAMAGDALARDAVVFGQVLEGLRNGNADLGIAPLRNGDALSALNQSQALWATMKKDLDAITGSSKNLFARAVRRRRHHHRLRRRCWTTARSCSTRSPRSVRCATRARSRNFWLGILSGVLALVSIVGLLWSLYRSRQREQETRYQTQVELNNRNQEAIMRLLDEMGSLAEGDLTVKATVTEDMTGAIADSINFAVDELRNLVHDHQRHLRAGGRVHPGNAGHRDAAGRSGRAPGRPDQLRFRARSTKSRSASTRCRATPPSRPKWRSARCRSPPKGAGVVRQTIGGMD